MLAEAQETGQIFDKDKLAFLADPIILEALITQQIVPQNSAFQTDDLDAYDSDCDGLSSAKTVLMANLSSCDPEVLSEHSLAFLAEYTVVPYALLLDSYNTSQILVDQLHNFPLK
nr:hypothetical protein [Tanacetum cinerariifolium]